MAADITTFAKQMVGAGVKPSLFEVNGSIGGANLANNGQAVPFLIKAASLPGTAIGTIEVPFRGRKIKLPGDRTFADWSITIINDSNFSLRNAFETWINNIQGMQSNTSTPAFATSFTPFLNPLFQDWTVNQLNRQGTPIKAYKLIGCFPTDISAIDLSFESTDQIEEFQVTLAYSYFATDSTTPDVTDGVKLTPLT
jgi:hypothetical protein